MFSFPDFPGSTTPETPVPNHVVSLLGPGTSPDFSVYAQCFKEIKFVLYELLLSAQLVDMTFWSGANEEFKSLGGLIQSGITHLEQSKHHAQGVKSISCFSYIHYHKAVYADVRTHTWPLGRNLAPDSTGMDTAFNYSSTIP